MFIEAVTGTITRLARRGGRAAIVLPIVAGVLNVPLDEASQKRRVHASPLDGEPRQITGIAGMRVVGEPVLVYDHLKDRREPNHIPDHAMTAWKEADGTVNLMVPHFQNYRMRGGDLEHLASEPDPIFSSVDSASDKVETHYNYRHWLAAPYTFDGRTVYSLGHHEWYACLTAGDCGFSGPPTPTSTGSYQMNSWTNAVTSLVSRDGGASWQLNGRNGAHLITRERFTWSGSSALAKRIYRYGFNHTGIMTPSRIIREGDYYYSIAFRVHRDFADVDPITFQAPAQTQGWVLMRTTDPKSTSGWEGWVSGDEYVPLNSHEFTAFEPAPSAGHPQIIYDSNARVYVAIFTAFGKVGPVYYVTTPTLASPSWSPARPVEGTESLQTNPRAPVPTACSKGFQAGNYVSLIDTHSPGLNFEFTDGDPWLFYAYNPALGCGGDNLARDAVRVRLQIEYR